MTATGALLSRSAFLPGLSMEEALCVEPEGTQGPLRGWALAPQEASQAGPVGFLTSGVWIGDNSPTDPPKPRAVGPNSPDAAKRELRARRAQLRAFERTCKAQQLRDAGIIPKSCPHARPVLHGTCGHGAVRWILAPCGARECAYCGPRGRDKIAKRIVDGVKAMWTLKRRVTWLVLTFDRDVEKKAAVRHLGHYMRWLRAELKRNGVTDDVDYAATYEKQESGRLHINVLVSPWTYIAQRRLCDAWCREIKFVATESNRGYQGASVYVKAITADARRIGAEMAKQVDDDAPTPKDLGRYLSKFDQSVTEDRRVSFSRGWPRCDEYEPERVGDITWDRASQYDVDLFETERKLGEWVMCQGEYSRARHLPSSEKCECFSWKKPTAEEHRARLRRQFAKRMLLYGNQTAPTERCIQ